MIVFNKHIANGFIALFAVSLILPIGVQLSGQQTLSSEKRTLAPAPNLPNNFEDFREFPAKFDAFFSDHIGLRVQLTQFYNRLLNDIGTSAVDDVVLGKENWLFYAGQNVIDDYRNIALFSDEQLKRWSVALEARQDALKQQGIEYLFVVAPNKHTIYGEYLPEHIEREAEQSRLDQLARYLEDNTQVNFLDLRSAVLRHKDSYQLYWRQDTHWNKRGASFAQYAIAQKLASMGIDINPIDTSAFNWDREYDRAVDLAEMQGLGNNIVHQSASFDPRLLPCSGSISKSTQSIPNMLKVQGVAHSNCAQSSTRALVFRDSFSTELLPFLANYFAQAQYVWTLPNQLTFDYFVDAAVDLVIEQRVERSLQYLPADGSWDLTLPKRQQTQLQDAFESAIEEIFALNAKNRQALTLRNVIANSDAAEFDYRSTSWNPQIITPRIKFHDNDSVLIEIQINSDSNSKMRLFYATPETPNFTPQAMIERIINKGNNTYLIKLEGVREGSRLRLDPLRNEGEFSLTSFKVKSIK